ncbi:MAG: RagB/SusD family nutrient uptake outer membrane protein, partial [Prolixibacteraceae bacterium]|nr:RagB/SusD family nutrient uptake outer membrane protein [Prolixibacteraceae bacterium]
PDASQAWKNQAKGQALFLRGLCYFEMFKRYGGVPLVDSIPDPANAEAQKIPRSSVEETVNFIVKDADAAASLLPDKWPSQHTGRATKGAALMLKSRTLLYAASPLYNTSTPPIDLPGHNELICYGNYDVKRWEAAADAAKAVIDWAPSAGCHLITDQGVDKNYKYVWETPGNAEIIMPSNITGNPEYPTMSGVWDVCFLVINNFYVNSAGTMVTQNFVEKYEKKDGTPQIWDPVGGDNLSQMYAELDPRFGQTIGYNNSYWSPDFPVLKLWEGEGSVPANQPPRFGCKTGYWQRKLVPERMNWATLGWMIWNLYRLAEAHLNYAEALNEMGRTEEAREAVRPVRERSGMPPFPSGMDQKDFRKKIRNERSIELALEEHRLWDIMRWRIAEEEGVMQGNMRGIKITRQGPDFSYTQYVFEVRTWKPAMYHIPFYRGEVNKGYLIQNPGW